MATYYVSTATGNNANDGLSAANAWATITKAVGEVAAADTVRIAPGTYREKPSLTTAGTSGNVITWIPDPEAQYFPAVNPGIVRVTGCGTDEIPTTGVVWTFGQNYNTLGDANKKYNQIFIDGTSSAGCVAYATSTAREFYGVTVIGHSGFTGGHTSTTKHYHCIALAGYRAFGEYASFDARHCIGIGASSSFYRCDTNSCLGIGGGWAPIERTTVNNIALGCGTGYDTNSGTNTLTNCIALACLTGFTTKASDTLVKCRAIACWRGFWNAQAVDRPSDVSDCSHVYCVTDYRADPYTTENSTATLALLYNLAPMIEALRPVLQFVFNDGDNTVTVGDYDILGLARRLGDGTIDIGPYAHSDVTNNFTEGSPALEFDQAGMSKFVFWAEGSVAFTKQVDVKWSNYAGANKPQIIVDGDHVTRGTTTATGDGTAYEEISVSATPAADGEVELFLYARDTGAYATLSTDLTGDNNDLVYTAKLLGALGNDITVTYTDPSAAEEPLAVAVVGNAITVTLETDVDSTIITIASDIATAIAASATANALVSVANKAANDGTGVVTAMTASSLSGGLTAKTYFKDLE